MKKLMLFLLFFGSFSVQAQWVTIPDTAFAHFLRVKFPACMNVDQMDTTCPGIVNATIINAQNLNIQSIEGIQYFDNLDNLICASNEITVLPARLPAKITSLHCEYNQLDSLPALPASLDRIFCYGNQLTSLPPLPSGLQDLYCQYNQITSLPVLPDTLQALTCGSNPITALPVLPDSLASLICDHCSISTLPLLPPSLWYLDCEKTLITDLPVLPSSLLSLLCGGNAYTNFPPLPAGLKYFNCNRATFPVFPTLPNGLETLNYDFTQPNLVTVYPDSLRSLSCESSQLTSLPPLPSKLIQLNCEHNDLTSLPPFPNTIVDVRCNNNELTSLPPFPASLDRVQCQMNQLTHLPELPDSMSMLAVYKNPLVCLPRLTRLGYFNFSNTLVTCLPNYGKVRNPTPLLSTLPLCDVFNPTGCPVFWNINGTVYNDANGNCQQESAEPGAKNMKLNLYEQGALVQQVYSITSGDYSFDTDTGAFTYSIDTSALPFNIICPATNADTSVLTPADSVDYDRDFAVQCKPGFDVSAWSVVATNHIFPGDSTYVQISAGDWASYWGQRCNTSGVSGQLTLTISGPAIYLAPRPGALMPTSSTTTAVTYTISDWEAVDPETAFGIIVQTGIAASMGQLVCFDITVTPAAGDNNTANNTLHYCLPVVNSLDPNDKQVSPSGDIDTTQEWLTYTIRFQNTGTAAARHIYIADTLDVDLDVSAFQLLSYSHQPLVQLEQNAVRFNFPNINLPDSTSNEPGSHGYVQYKVKLKQGLPVGTQIENTAAIYFDFNPPVITNTVSNTIACTQQFVAISPVSRTLCRGESVSLTASGAATFSWNTGSSNSALVVTPLTTETFTVTGTDANGCTANASATVTVTQPDTTSSQLSLCTGDSAFFNGQYYTASGDYAATFAASGGCDSISILNLSFYSLPQPVITQTNDTLSTGAFAGYLWLLDGNLVPYQSFQQLRVTQNGNYSVVVTDGNGCKDTSAVWQVTGVGVEEMTNDDLRMTIYPNPNNGNFTLQFSDSKVREVIIVNIFGKVVLRDVAVKGMKEFTLSNEAAGVYFVRVVEGERVRMMKVAIED